MTTPIRFGSLHLYVGENKHKDPHPQLTEAYFLANSQDRISDRRRDAIFLNDQLIGYSEAVKKVSFELNEKSHTLAQREEWLGDTATIINQIVSNKPGAYQPFGDPNRNVFKMTQPITLKECLANLKPVTENPRVEYGNTFLKYKYGPS